MLYFLYEWLSRGGHEHVPVLNLLKYLTFRTGMALLTAYVVAVAMGSRFIRWMQAKQGKGQPIRTDGIERHVTEKAGTPTMGGFDDPGRPAGRHAAVGRPAQPLRLGGAGASPPATACWASLDDYAKVTKQTTGRRLRRPKLIARVQSSSIAVAAMALITSSPPQLAGEPGAGDLGGLPDVQAAAAQPRLVLRGLRRLSRSPASSNAVNLTDGLDGLAIVPVMIAAAAFGLIAYLVGNVTSSPTTCRSTSCPAWASWR